MNDPTNPRGRKATRLSLALGVCFFCGLAIAHLWLSQQGNDIAAAVVGIGAGCFGFGYLLGAASTIEEWVRGRREPRPYDYLADLEGEEYLRALRHIELARNIDKGER